MSPSVSLDLETHGTAEARRGEGRADGGETDSPIPPLSSGTRILDASGEPNPMAARQRTLKLALLAFVATIAALFALAGLVWYSATEHPPRATPPTTSPGTP